LDGRSEFSEWLPKHLGNHSEFSENIRKLKENPLKKADFTQNSSHLMKLSPKVVVLMKLRPENKKAGLMSGFLAMRTKSFEP